MYMNDENKRLIDKIAYLLGEKVDITFDTVLSVTYCNLTINDKLVAYAAVSDEYDVYFMLKTFWAGLTYQYT